TAVEEPPNATWGSSTRGAGFLPRTLALQAMRRRLARLEPEAARPPAVRQLQFCRCEADRSPRRPLLSWSSQVDLCPIKRPGSVPRGLTEVPSRDAGAGLVADLDLFAFEVAPGSARCPNMNAERMVNHDRRRYIPDRQAGVVGHGFDRYRKRAFLVDKAFGLMLREYESPRMLAHLLRGHEGKFCRFVGFVGKVGKPTHRHDGTIGRHDVDDSSAKVASVGAGDLDLQDDVSARVDLRSRRPTQRHAGEMRPWLFVRALDTLAHALVRLRRRNSRNAAGLRASARRWFRNGFELGNPSPALEASLSAGAARRPSGVKSSEAAGDEVSAQAMLGQTTHGFAAGIEAGDDLAENIDHLLVRIDPEAGERIVEDGSRPRRIERRPLDLVHRFGLLEVGVDARRDEGVVPLNSLLEDRSRHRP